VKFNILHNKTEQEQNMRYFKESYAVVCRYMDGQTVWRLVAKYQQCCGPQAL